MRIESIHIIGFGCLSERTYEFPADKAVLVLESNESGKSTLAAAIVAGLCGFPKRKGAGEAAKLKDVFKPWSGDAYAIEMEIEADGERYVIERDFARDRFTIREKATNRDISAQCNSDLALHFLKLPREDFGRVAIISGKEAHVFGSSPNIQARLSALVDGAQDETGGDIAIAALENAKYTLGRAITTENAIKRLSEAISEKRAAMGALDLSLEAAGVDAGALDDARVKQKQLTADLAGLDNEYKAARLREVRERIASLEANSEDVTELERELGELECYAAFPVERSGQLTRAVARMGERKTSAKNLQDRQELALRDSDEIRSAIDDGEHFAAASKDDLAGLKSCEDSLKAAADSAARKSSEIELAKRGLANEGLDVASCVEQWRSFERLPSADREFLSAFRENELELQAEQNRAEADEAGFSEHLQVIRQSQKQGRFGGILLAAGGLLGLGSVALLILRVIDMGLSIAGVVVGAMIAAAGIVRIIRAKGRGSDEETQLKAAIEDARSLAILSRARCKENNAKLAAISSAAGIENPGEVVSVFKQSDKAFARCESLNPLIAQLTLIEESMKSARDRAQGLLRRLGVNFDGESDFAELLLRVHEDLARYISDRERLRGLELEMSAREREIEQALSGFAEEQAIALDILKDAEIGEGLPFDEALRKFEEAEKHYRRYKEIKDALLPAAAKHAAPDEARAKMREEEAELALALDGVAIDTGKSSSDMENERQATRMELDTVGFDVSNLEKRVGGCVDTYRNSYPRLREEVDDLEIELAKASRFKDALEVAARVMREVCEESRKKWASALNKRASVMLPHLNASYDNMLFDDSLGFSIRHIADNRIIQKSEVDACLSTGAKDQIYLAVRLACCGELSKLGESMPIILDDPLMAADDSRFDSGFEFIARELPRSQQVIVLSCHESRHMHLQGQPWFSDHVAVVEL